MTEAKPRGYYDKFMPLLMDKDTKCGWIVVGDPAEIETGKCLSGLGQTYPNLVVRHPTAVNFRNRPFGNRLISNRVWTNRCVVQSE